MLRRVMESSWVIRFKKLLAEWFDLEMFCFFK